MKPSIIAFAGSVVVTLAVTSAGLAGSAGAMAAVSGRPATPAAHSPVDTVTLISPASGAVAARVHFSGFPQQLAVPGSGSSAYVICYGTTGLIAYKITPGERARVRRIASSGTATAMTVSPDGKTLYMAQPRYSLGRAKIVPVSTSTGRSGRPAEVRGLGTVVEAISVEPDSKIMYVAGGSAVAAVRVATRKVIGRPMRLGPKSLGNLTVTQMSYSRSGARLFVLSSLSTLRYSLLTVVNTRTNREVGFARVPGTVLSDAADLAVTPDGSLAYVVSSEFTPGATLNFVSVLHIGVKVSKVRTLSIQGATAVAEAPSGRAAYATGANYFPSETGQLTAIPTATNKPSSPVTVAVDTPLNLVISPASTTAYVIEANDEVYPVNLATNTVGSPISAGPQPGYFLGSGGMAFTGNGRILYVLGTATE